MACNFVKATSVEIVSATGAESYYSITVPETVDLSSSGCLCIGLFTTIPNTISCAPVQVTNGTDSVYILRCNGDYWRPCNLKCRSVLHCEVLTDPPHLLIRGVRR